MIILKEIKSENKFTSFLEFTNEHNKVISVPVPVDIANLILSHVRLLSASGNNFIERGNDEDP